MCRDQFVEWLEPWYPVAGERAAGLEEELRRELTPGHALHGLAVRARAHRKGSDNVLFAIEDDTGRVAVVHLTWTAKPPERLPWPKATLFASFEAWSRDGMLADHDAQESRRHNALMKSKALFIDAVQATPALPALLREHAEDVAALEESRFDASYIAFLDKEIRLGLRGPEWTKRLARRRAALLPFCDVMLLQGTVRVGDIRFTVDIHPETRVVIHWEEYEYG